MLQLGIPIRKTLLFSHAQFDTQPSSDLSSPCSSFSSFSSSSLSDLRPSKSHLTELERKAIITLAADQQPTSMVATKINCIPKTVRKWVHHFEEERDVEDAYRSGRPKITTEEEDDAIVDAAIERPRRTPKAIRRSLDLSHVSAKTIRRRLDETGLFGRIARPSPPLTDFHRLKRLSFANGYGNWTDEQWGKVLWSDETSLQLGVNGQTWVQRPIGEAFNKDYVVHQVKHPPKHHMWACFFAHGTGHFMIFRENLDAKLMIKIISKCLLRSKNAFWKNQHWWFQQDNDPKHSSKLVQNWLFKAGVQLIDWPSNSPDLNPIKNLWHYLKRRVEARNPKNLEQLEEMSEEEWLAIPKEFCRKLAMTMRTRCMAVIENNGWLTKY